MAKYAKCLLKVVIVCSASVSADKHYVSLCGWTVLSHFCSLQIWFLYFSFVCIAIC